MAQATMETPIQFSDPPVAKQLFGSVKWAWIWVIPRLYVGYTWLSSGYGKLGNPAWTQTGEALQGFWQRAITVPDAPARPAIAFDWYRTFIQSLFDGGHYAWFAKLIVAGEILVGIALILGVDRILDMLRTSVNVTGDITASAVIARSEGEVLAPAVSVSG